MNIIGKIRENRLRLFGYVGRKNYITEKIGEIKIEKNR